MANEGWYGDVWRGRRHWCVVPYAESQCSRDQNQKTKFVEGPNPKINRKLHLLPSFPLFHHLQHMFIKLHRKLQKNLEIHQQTLTSSSTSLHKKKIIKNSMKNSFRLFKSKTHLTYLKVKSDLFFFSTYVIVAKYPCDYIWICYLLAVIFQWLTWSR